MKMTKARLRQIIKEEYEKANSKLLEQEEPTEELRQKFLGFKDTPPEGWYRWWKNGATPNVSMTTPSMQPDGSYTRTEKTGTYMYPLKWWDLEGRGRELHAGWFFNNDNPKEMPPWGWGGHPNQAGELHFHHPDWEGWNDETKPTVMANEDGSFTHRSDDKNDPWGKKAVTTNSPKPPSPGEKAALPFKGFGSALALTGKEAERTLAAAEEAVPDPSAAPDIDADVKATAKKEPTEPEATAEKPAEEEPAGVGKRTPEQKARAKELLKQFPPPIPAGGEGGIQVGMSKDQVWAALRSMGINPKTKWWAEGKYRDPKTPPRPAFRKWWLDYRKKK